MADQSELLQALNARVESAMRYLGADQLAARRADLEAELGDPKLWDDPEHAKEVTRSFGQVNADLELLDRLRGDLEEAALANELVIEGATEFETEVDAKIASLDTQLSDLEVRTLLSGEFDEGDAICEIHAGVGGTDAQDWAEMMLRMYQRYCEQRGYEFEIDEITEGQEAGILSVTFIARGRYAYGRFVAEKGVHRLVRISPFDSQKRRQTSFASFEATPLIPEASSDVPIDEKDLRIDTYRSSGAGGQHVNVTDSAVRITHLPTGIVVSCQNERSQLQNKAKAMQILRSKLAEVAREERRASLEAIAGPQSDVGWGSQIRSYVMAPYQMVKDHRSNYEDGNVAKVLDGDLDGFIESYLRWRRSRQNEVGA
jgi:peptide chain release factor 2